MNLKTNSDMEKYFYAVTVAPPPPIPIEEQSFLEKLITTTCRLMDIERDLLYEQCRRPRITHARWMIWEIMIAVRRYSLKEAGSIFCNRDHTTVLHGLNQLLLDLQHDDLLAAIYKELVNQMDIKQADIDRLRNQRELNRMDRLTRQPHIAA